MANPTHTIAHNALSFSGADIAGNIIRSDGLKKLAINQIREAVAALIDGRISGKTFVYIGNDFREAIRANNGTKGQLAYFADQARKAAGKAGKTLELRQSTAADKSMRYTRAIITDAARAASDAPNDGATDSAGRQSSDTDAKRGVDHEVIRDRLQAWVAAGVSADTILENLLLVAVPNEKHETFLRAALDRVNVVRDPRSADAIAADKDAA